MLVHRTSVCSFATEFALNLAARPSRPSLFKVNRPRPAPRLASSSRPARKLSDAPFTSSEFKASSAAQGSIVVAPFATLFYDTVKMLARKRNRDVSFFFLSEEKSVNTKRPCVFSLSWWKYYLACCKNSIYLWIGKSWFAEVLSFALFINR